ncbi:MAG: hypothetical protein MI924_18605 [Chloroflexales bacterium]|nr:hypothetical protein [Chloroflexales bacterium]
MILTGYTQRIEQDLTPEQIIAPVYADSGDPALLAAHCLAAIDPHLAEVSREGDVLVVNGRLHTGAQAEIAVIALQALGFAAVICAEAADSIVALAGVYGLPILIQATAATALSARQIVRIDLERGAIEERETSLVWRSAPCPPEVIAATRRNQMLLRMRRVVEDEGFAE